MKFTLQFYTDGWESGPTVELSHIPAPGSIVWTGGRRRDEEDSMYYVDNVMYPERGMDREDTVYLYVRPYTGYTRLHRREACGRRGGTGACGGEARCPACGQRGAS